eukprot:1063877-Pleurochrysis_carterae.AAC.2
MYGASTGQSPLGAPPLHGSPPRLPSPPPLAWRGRAAVTSKARLARAISEETLASYYECRLQDVWPRLKRAVLSLCHVLNMLRPRS